VLVVCSVAMNILIGALFAVLLYLYWIEYPKQCRTYIANLSKAYSLHPVSEMLPEFTVSDMQLFTDDQTEDILLKFKYRGEIAFLAWFKQQNGGGDIVFDCKSFGASWTSISNQPPTRIMLRAGCHRPKRYSWQDGDVCDAVKGHSDSIAVDSPADESVPAGR